MERREKYFGLQIDYEVTITQENHSFSKYLCMCDDVSFRCIFVVSSSLAIPRDILTLYNMYSDDGMIPFLPRFKRLYSYDSFMNISYPKFNTSYTLQRSTKAMLKAFLAATGMERSHGSYACTTLLR